METPKIYSVILELGNMTVFGFRTQDEITKDTPCQAVFWTEKTSGNTYGPFNTLFDAMQHYTWMREAQTTKTEAPVIYVDFVKRQKITL